MTGSTTTVRRRFRLAILGACLAAAFSFLTAGSAEALQFTQHEFSKNFTVSGMENVKAVAVDQQSGSVYVLTGQPKLYKFDAEGNPSNFSSTGTSVISIPGITVGGLSTYSMAVDNSGGPHQGRIFVGNNYIDNTIWAYEPSGAPVGGNFPLEFLNEDFESIAVSPVNGSLWMTGTPLSDIAYEYTSDGAKTSHSVDLYHKFGESSELGIGPSGEFFVYQGGPGFTKINASGQEVLGQYQAAFSELFAVDQVSGTFYSVRYGYAVPYDSNNDELPYFEYEGGGEGQERGAAINGVSGNMYVAYATHVALFEPQAPVTLPDTHLQPPTNIGPNSVTLNASVNPDGVTTNHCAFEYTNVIEFGFYVNYEINSPVPCQQGQALSGTSPIAVSANIPGLQQGATYHYRFATGNPNGPLYTEERTFVTSDLPVVTEPYVTDVHSDSVVFHAEITPEGAPTTFHVLYGTGDCTTEPETCGETQETSSVGSGLIALRESTTATGLKPGTTYHYVVVATNQSGSTESSEGTFTTFPETPFLEDKCANAHVRQQTGAALLADCRAYELVSAANANGYDVESYLNSEQSPFGGYPDAQSRVLYGIHSGALQGVGNPTNHGIDPYVASRGEDGWNTTYVGIPANLPYSEEAFASPVAGASASLETFAFGGQGLCSPCFSDHTTGVPVRLADGSLVQGMQGSLEPGTSAAANMLVKKPLSADGKHLIFGSTSEFEENAGSPAIYDRDLATGITHAVSKLPGGGAIPCLMHCSSDGLAELDVSADGSRIVIGQLISTDSAGNDYWHLYMNVNDSAQTIDLTPGTTSGALYGGMTEDGSRVYFTTPDRLLSGEDTDSSADLYEAQVSPTSATLHLVSKGAGAGNSDSCDPEPNSVNEHWNTVGSTANCDAVAVGGGGGVAAEDGTVYFLSPELLDGSSEPEDGQANQPNLYVARPGSAPEFVTTLESNATGPNPLLKEHRFKEYFGASKNPEYVAVDNSGGPSDGDVYVADVTEKTIRKFDAEGNLITSWKEGGSFKPNLGAAFAGIAVGPNGVLYVAIAQELNGSEIRQLFEYEEDGTLLAQRHVPSAPHSIGIAVDEFGRVYFEGYNEVIWRWSKNEGSYPLTAPSYGELPQKKGLAVSPSGNALYIDWGGTEIARLDDTPSDEFVQPGGSLCPESCEPTEIFGKGEFSNGGQMFVDPTNEELYVDVGNRILRYHGNGRRGEGPDTGVKLLSNSTSVAVSSAGNLYATNVGSEGANVAAFGPLVQAPDPRTDSPVVVDSVNDNGTRHTGDFQVNPSGDDAVFPTTIPLTGYTNGGHEEIFRYDQLSQAIDCASCNPTGALGTGDAKLAPNGLSLTDEGSVFFDSAEPLVPSDLDNREDVYEWEKGKVSLISTGLSPFNSSLLSASSTGADVYFFTRDTLARQDLNGALVKIYDARENGGFPYLPPPVSCKASDECHGASSPTPNPPSIGTITGSTGNHVPAKSGTKCRKGFVKRHGHCVKRQKRHKHHRSRAHHRAGGKRTAGHGRGGH